MGLGQGPIEDLVPLNTQKGQRASQLKLVFKGGDSRMINANEFRSALGFSALRSTLFQVEKKEGAFEFHGRGSGHGVGLCQWGSRNLAMAGGDASAILKHYYPLGQLRGRLKNSSGNELKRTGQQE